MFRLLYIILYVVLAATASAQVKAAIKREQKLAQIARIRQHLVTTKESANLDT